MGSLTRIAKAFFVVLRCRYSLTQSLVHQSKPLPEDMCSIFTNDSLVKQAIGVTEWVS
jgi:hypothetical protein